MADAPSPFFDGLFRMTVRANGAEVGTATVLNLGAGLAASLNGTTKAIDVSATGTAPPVYVRATLPTSASDGVVQAWLNDTGAAVAISSLYFVPSDAVSRDDTNYWEVMLVLGSAVTSPLTEITTQTTGGIALASGTAVSLGSTVSVPALDTLVMRLKAHGSPTSLGGTFQGRAAAT